MSKVKPQQSLWDYALQTTGSIEAVFDIAVANNLSVTGNLTAGVDLIDATVSAPRVLTYYERKKVSVATAIKIETIIVSNWILATGFWNDLGFWDDTANWID